MQPPFELLVAGKNRKVFFYASKWEGGLRGCSEAQFLCSLSAPRPLLCLLCSQVLPLSWAPPGLVHGISALLSQLRRAQGHWLGCADISWSQSEGLVPRNYGSNVLKAQALNEFSFFFNLQGMPTDRSATSNLNLQNLSKRLPR